MPIATTMRFLSGLSWTARTAYVIDHFAGRLPLPPGAKKSVRGAHRRALQGRQKSPIVAA